jgi:hypothetical protein
MSIERPRPPLDQQITPADFRAFYWLKAELQDFCRAHGLSSAGGKQDLAQRIDHFLQTGQRDLPTTTKPRPSSPTEPDSLETLITEGFICSQEKRAFFQSVIGPQFRFSVKMQAFFRANIGKTYQEAVDEWHRLEAEKKAGKKDPIDPQFEYNRFIRAFYDDLKNQSLPLAKAIQAWKVARSRPSAPVYSPDEDYFLAD